MSSSDQFDLAKRIADLERRLDNTIVEGVVVEVQASPYRVRVNYGTASEQQLTGWLPVAVPRAASATVWWPLEQGEGVTIISPSGNLEQGRVFRGRTTEDNPPPSQDLDLLLVQFGDGGHFQCHRGSGVGEIKAITKLVLDTEVEITKNLNVVGTSNAADHLSGAAEISGKGHKHTGDSGGTTSAPI